MQWESAPGPQRRPPPFSIYDVRLVTYTWAAGCVGGRGKGGKLRGRKAATDQSVGFAAGAQRADQQTTQHALWVRPQPSKRSKFSRSWGGAAQMAAISISSTVGHGCEIAAQTRTREGYVLCRVALGICPAGADQGAATSRRPRRVQQQGRRRSCGEGSVTYRRNLCLNRPRREGNNRAFA
jgi:hypothetical protein